MDIRRMFCQCAVAVLLFGVSVSAFAQVRGIYINQSTLEDTNKITYLIQRAKASGINTFVIDFNRLSQAYHRNIELVKNSGIKYVARITVFPGGASQEQMASLDYRQNKFNKIKQALAMGAQEIQLDYIRYTSKNAPSLQNAQNVNTVIKWFKTQLEPYKVPLQIDVFGITAFHHETRIGQYPKVFANSVDSINPMVYPSHYSPYQEHSAQPYKTVYNSLEKLQQQLKDQNPVKIIAYIEAYNYHYPSLTREQKFNYVTAQMKAVQDANVAGWYVWSANNYYDHVFDAAQLQQAKQAQAASNNTSGTMSRVSS